MGNFTVMQVQKVWSAVVGFERSQILRAEMRVRLFAGQDPGFGQPVHESVMISRLVGRFSKSVIQGLRPAKLHENESKPLHVFNGLAHISDPAVVNRKREVI
jgi:hypothetical protein